MDYPEGRSASDPSFVLDAQTGTIFLFYNYIDRLKEKDIYYLHVIKSMDHGRIWFLKRTPIKFADESKIIELKDGTWMVNSRVNKLGMRYVSTSKDQGESWESREDSSLIDPSCHAAIIRYDYNGKNNLLFVNAASKHDRKNLMLRVSDDEGKSWSAGQTIFTGSAAYSDIVVLKNGDLGILFERNNYQENVFVRFTYPQGNRF